MALLLNDNFLIKMSSRQDIVREFPFMKLKVAKGSGCKCNQNANKASNNAEYNRVKESIKTLPEERLARLKALLRATSIVFFLNGPAGVQRVEL